ncbi:MAG: nucleotidyltransferase domain-containing protein [Candidatus Nanoarchaeia archaeon]
MLNIINELKPFFEDNYRRIHVREYAKMQKISPPTASKTLERLCGEKLLKKEIYKQYYLYFANKDSSIFRDLQRIYWKIKLQPLISEINKHIFDPVIVLFGSIAKAEAKSDSDIDLAVLSPSKKNIEVKKFEKKLKRKIQVFIFKKLEEVPTELKSNILNGYILEGSF